jgi:hypothetical protein
MVVLPMDTGVASPAALMVATEVLLELQTEVVVTFPIEPSEKVAVAVNCWGRPADSEIDGFAGLMVMEVMVLLLTVSEAVPFTLPDVAVMVVVPRATAVARPELSMVAMLGAEDVQVTWELTLLTVLLPSVPVAVNCWVLPGRIIALAGDSEIDTIVFAEGKNPPQLLSKIAARSPAPSLPSHVSRCTLIVPPFLDSGAR